MKPSLTCKKTKGFREDAQETRPVRGGARFELEPLVPGLTERDYTGKPYEPGGIDTSAETDCSATPESWH